MDLSLFVTIGLIFLVTSAVGYARSRISDRCLRSFHRFNVTLLRTDGKRAWGRMTLSAGGIELAFPTREHSAPGMKTTYLLYAGEYPLIQAILRYADRLTDDERRARDADIARSFRPGPLRRFARTVRNFIGSATDSLRDVLALVLGRVQKLQDRFVAAEGTDAGQVGVRLQTVRDVDMILPRSRAAVRHRASELPPAGEPESTWDFVFDLGTLIMRRGADDADEARLRESLERAPDDVAAAARLGGLLLRKQDYAGAGRWLRAAYNGRDTLPDGGRRVRMQLRELSR